MYAPLSGQDNHELDPPVRKVPLYFRQEHLTNATDVLQISLLIFSRCYFCGKKEIKTLKIKSNIYYFVKLLSLKT